VTGSPDRFLDVRSSLSAPSDRVGPRAPVPMSSQRLPISPRGRLGIGLAVFWVAGIVITFLAGRFVHSMSCMFDATGVCARRADAGSSHMLWIGTGVLVGGTLLALGVYRLTHRDDGRRR
jgi:hypothetical protein